jgi:hypothetical protein
LGGKNIQKILKNSPKSLEETTIFLKNKNIIDYLDRYIKIMGVSKFNMSESLLQFFISIKNLCGLKFLFILIRSKGKIIYINKSEKKNSPKISINLGLKKKDKNENIKSKKSSFSLCNIFRFCKLNSDETPAPNSIKITSPKVQFKKIFSLAKSQKLNGVSKSVVRSLEETIQRESSDDLDLSMMKMKYRFSSGEENFDKFEFSDDEERIEKLIPKIKFEINANVAKYILFNLIVIPRQNKPIEELPTRH